MAINARDSKQNWQVGQVVNVGFLRGLAVEAIIPTPGDYAPDVYVLVMGEKRYEFTPHRGIERVK